MIYLAWILLILALAGMGWIFGRRLMLTLRDQRLQEELVEEERLEEEAELGVVEPEETVASGARVSVTGLIEEGLAFLQAAQHELAEERLLAAVVEDPTSIDAHQHLGGLYLKTGRFPEAEYHFSSLTSLRKDPVFYSNLGAALYQQKRLQEAAQAYENAVSLDSRRAARLESLAQIYHELGEFEKALKYFELASRKKPKDTDLRMLLTDYYERMDQIPAALEQLDVILKENPGHGEAAERRKSLQKLAKELEKARENEEASN